MSPKICILKPAPPVGLYLETEPIARESRLTEVIQVGPTLIGLALLQGETLEVSLSLHVPRGKAM